MSCRSRHQICFVLPIWPNGRAAQQHVDMISHLSDQTLCNPQAKKCTDTSDGALSKGLILWKMIGWSTFSTSPLRRQARIPSPILAQSYLLNLSCRSKTWIVWRQVSCCIYIDYTFVSITKYFICQTYWWLLFKINRTLVLKYHLCSWWNE